MLKDLQEIERLKEEENAIILAHNYQTDDIQDIADFVGDSLELCIKALEIKEADTVVFCGVDFMAETAAILNPCKKVLIPDKGAVCQNMKLQTVDKVKKCLLNEKFTVHVDEKIANKAKLAIKRMIEVSKS